MTRYLNWFRAKWSIQNAELVNNISLGLADAMFEKQESQVLLSGNSETDNAIFICKILEHL